MAANNDVTNEPNLTNAMPVLGTGGTAVDPREDYYADVEGGEWGLVTRKHSDRVERLDVTGWEIVEHTLDDDEFETYEDEIVEWIGDALRGDAKFVSTTWLDTFRYELVDGEGDSFVIELDVQNHRVLSR
jgi:hypothetical protein